MVIVNLFIVLYSNRPIAQIYYNPDIIADEFKTYSVALKKAVVTSLVVCSGSEAVDAATTNATPAVVMLATVVVVVDSCIFGINIAGVIAVVVVVVVVVLMNAKDAFVVAGCSGMYGYDGQGFINCGPSIDSNTYAAIV